MPYLDKTAIDALLERQTFEKPGELNYIITSFCLDYLDDNGVSYTTLNEVIGVLECAKQEFYRRLVAVYEDDKAAKNGDVYERQ